MFGNELKRTTSHICSFSQHQLYRIILMVLNFPCQKADNWDKLTRAQLPQNRPSHLLILQAIVVAGGFASTIVATDRQSISLSRAVRILLPGATAWDSLASLPRVLYNAHASIVGGRFRLTGGADLQDSVRTEVSDSLTKLSNNLKLGCLGMWVLESC